MARLCSLFVLLLIHLLLYSTSAEGLQDSWPTARSWTKMVQLNKVCLKRQQKGEKFHDWTRTCSHPIYVQTLTGVHQAVRYFLLAIFHVSISIGPPESNSLSLSTPSRTKWTLFIYFAEIGCGGSLQTYKLSSFQVYRHYTAEND